MKKNFHHHVIVYIRPIELVGCVNNQRTHARHLYRLEKLEKNWNEFRIQLIYYLSAFRIVANADGLLHYHSYEWGLWIVHLSIPVYHLSIPVYHLSIPVYHLSIPVYHLSIPVYHLSIPVYHLSIPVYHLSRY